MFEVNQPHQIGFHAVDATTGDPVTGLGTSSFTVDIFTIDGTAITDATVLASVSVVNTSGAYYYASYTPKAKGFYYFGISNAAHGIYVADACDIDEANYVLLTQDTPTVGALKPTLPVTLPWQKTGFEQYLLMVIASSDWDVGRKTPNFAHAMTQLDSEGNWLAAPLVIVPGTYHVVIRNNFGVEKVIKAYLEV